MRISASNKKEFQVQLKAVNKVKLIQLSDIWKVSHLKFLQMKITLPFSH